MKGATEYAALFETGQYGRFYIVSDSHARGKTFHIQILPKDEIARPNGAGNLCLNGDAVEVYGIIGGRPGWDEYYGWKHFGPWQRDFEKLVEDRKNEKVRKEEERLANEAKIKTNQTMHELELLALY